MRTALAVLALALPAAAEECLAPPYTDPSTPAETRLAGMIADLRPVLDRFPSLAAAFDHQQPEFCLSDALTGFQGFLDPILNRIVLRTGIDDALARAVLLHELRHLEQYDRGFCPSNVLSMEENARATFAFEADASAVSHLVAWTLREDTGDTGVWDALEAWPSQADIAARFAATVAETGDTAAATAAAFAQWYAIPDRIEQYYIVSCLDYLDRQDADHLVPRYNALPDDFFDVLCRLPDGSPYACEAPEDPPRLR